MSDTPLIAASRIAFSALTHDLGKFVERASANTQKKPHAHTFYFHDALKQIHDVLPSAFKDDRIAAAAEHHAPQTGVQWIIATAERLASGFSAKSFKAYNQTDVSNHSNRTPAQTRLWSLFEGMRLDAKTADKKEWALPLKQLSPESIFPVKGQHLEIKNNEQARLEYAALWNDFVHAIKNDIPKAHRSSVPLWLDHFDAAYLAFTHAIPNAVTGKTRPDVSLYDHSKATAALAVALWQWEQGRTEAETVQDLSASWNNEHHSGLDTQKFLLIQGDFAGIQNLIFCEGSKTQKHAAKILRGRSFQVSLLCELAALRVLRALNLPSTSQIMNAAGKFGYLAQQGDLLRCWDFSLPNALGTPVFKGYARRDINAFTPLFEFSLLEHESSKYGRHELDIHPSLKETRVRDKERN